MSELYITYGSNPEEMAASVLRNLGVEKHLIQNKKDNLLIGIKPNLVVARPSEEGATTSPLLVKGVIQFLMDRGFHNIIILESAWIGDSTEDAFRVCGYENIAKEFGIPLIDLKKDRFLTFDVDGISINVCSKALEVDYLINMPVLKAHCQTKLTCALKNLKGCIPDKEKRHFHELGLHHPIACLNKVLKTELVVVDGITGDLTHEEGGTPVHMNRVIACFDPVLTDTYAAELIGYSPEEIGYIKMAEKMGIGSTDVQGSSIIELNSAENAPPATKIRANREIDYLSRWIDDDKACSACYGSLVHALKRLRQKGKLDKIPGRISIGQGFKKRKPGAIGIGTCTSKFTHSLPGCPPHARAIIDFLEKQV